LGFAFRFPDVAFSVRLVLGQRNDLIHERAPRRIGDGVYCPLVTRAPSKVLAAGFAGGIIGAAGGAAIAGSLEGSRWAFGALIGAAVLGTLTGWADATRTPG
jgi:hypothetical protein